MTLSSPRMPVTAERFAGILCAKNAGLVSLTPDRTLSDLGTGPLYQLVIKNHDTAAATLQPIVFWRL